MPDQADRQRPAPNSLTPAQVRAAAEQSALALSTAPPPGSLLVRRTEGRDDPAAVTAPTLVVTTAGCLTPAALQDELAFAVPDARTAEPATGHLPFLEQPNQWLETITGRLAERNDAR
ncbi:hypothetical protein [Streptomyces sp. NPDC000351]|uniref:alpha/beta fold hydrolase n=1 Tax=Streptomyces sp. NPDC000351 TaxID=3154250 RepID=UPI003317AA3E